MEHAVLRGSDQGRPVGLGAWTPLGYMALVGLRATVVIEVE
jgi:hypothetical protein